MNYLALITQEELDFNVDLLDSSSEVLDPIVYRISRSGNDTVEAGCTCVSKHIAGG